MDGSQFLNDSHWAKVFMPRITELFTLPHLFLLDSYWTPGFLHFSHPFLGTYEVVQFFDLGYLKGTHSGGWYTAPYPFHGMLG